jgi:hypothetical protein
VPCRDPSLTIAAAPPSAVRLNLNDFPVKLTCFMRHNNRGSTSFTTSSVLRVQVPEVSILFAGGLLSGAIYRPRLDRNLKSLTLAIDQRDPERQVRR